MSEFYQEMVDEFGDRLTSDTIEAMIAACVPFNPQECREQLAVLAGEEYRTQSDLQVDHHSALEQFPEALKQEIGVEDVKQLLANQRDASLVTSVSVDPSAEISYLFVTLTFQRPEIPVSVARALGFLDGFTVKLKFSATTELIDAEVSAGDKFYPSFAQLRRIVKTAARLAFDQVTGDWKVPPEEINIQNIQTLQCLEAIEYLNHLRSGCAEEEAFHRAKRFGEIPESKIELLHLLRQNDRFSEKDAFTIVKELGDLASEELCRAACNAPVSFTPRQSVIFGKLLSMNYQANFDQYEIEMSAQLCGASNFNHLDLQNYFNRAHNFLRAPKEFSAEKRLMFAEMLERGLSEELAIEELANLQALPESAEHAATKPQSQYLVCVDESVVLVNRHAAKYNPNLDANKRVCGASSILLYLVKVIEKRLLSLWQYCSHCDNPHTCFSGYTIFTCLNPECVKKEQDEARLTSQGNRPIFQLLQQISERPSAYALPHQWDEARLKSLQDTNLYHLDKLPSDYFSEMKCAKQFLFLPVDPRREEMFSQHLQDLGSTQRRYAFRSCSDGEWYAVLRGATVAHACKALGTHSQTVAPTVALAKTDKCVAICEVACGREEECPADHPWKINDGSRIICRFLFVYDTTPSLPDVLSTSEEFAVSVEAAKKHFNI